MTIENNLRIYKVAIIDDLKAQRENIAGFFYENFDGCSDITKFENPEEALKVITNREGIFDLIFVDYMMPNYMDGLEFTKIIKQFNPDIYVVMITSNTENNKIIMDALASNLLNDVFDKNNLFEENGKLFITTIVNIFKYIDKKY